MCFDAQVVLLGCGMDTRPFRLPWPVSTVLFLLAPAEVHAAAAAALKAAGAAVPRGCLLRRVPIDLQVSLTRQSEDCGADFAALRTWAILS